MNTSTKAFEYSLSEQKIHATMASVAAHASYCKTAQQKQWLINEMVRDLVADYDGWTKDAPGWDRGTSPYKGK